MALIICKDCKKEFSTDVRRCPHCGAKKPTSSAHFLITAALIISVIIALDSGRKSAQEPGNINDGAFTACVEYQVKHNGSFPIYTAELARQSEERLFMLCDAMKIIDKCIAAGAAKESCKKNLTENTFWTIDKYQ